jgi:hypothetical protein
MLEASFLGAQASATAFGLLRPVKGATIATAPLVTAVALAAIIVASRIAVRRRTEIALLTRGPTTVFSDVQPQLAATELATIELLDRLSGVLFRREPNEGEASRASAFAILWNVNVNDLADLSKKLTKLLVRRAEIEVPYEYLT